MPPSRGCGKGQTMRRSLIALLVLVAGCAYGFAGGGLPKEIRTVAVLPFDNLTSDPTTLFMQQLPMTEMPQ